MSYTFICADWKGHYGPPFNPIRHVEKVLNGIPLTRVLKSMQKMNRLYCAVERLDPVEGRSVFAAVALLKMIPRAKSDENFGYAIYSETSGPDASDCPEEILDLLTPTTNAYAIKWRERCRQHIADRKCISLSKGDRISFSEPIRFLNGNSYTDFIVIDARREWLRPVGEESGCFRIRGLRDRMIRDMRKAPTGHPSPQP